MERREILGNVVTTVLSSNISNSATTITVADASTFPTGSLNPFVISIDKGTSDEEKILITQKGGNNFFVKARGFDGTVAVAHSAGAVVDHVLDANAVLSMNKTVFDTSILYWMGV
jgi:hypothetical protein